jgi:hypothetical protein
LWIELDFFPDWTSFILDIWKRKRPAEIDGLGWVVVCGGDKDRLPPAPKWRISPPFSKSEVVRAIYEVEIWRYFRY